MSDYTKQDMQDAFVSAWAACLYRGNPYADIDATTERTAIRIFNNWFDQNYEDDPFVYE
jgi:hypothetical protein